MKLTYGLIVTLCDSFGNLFCTYNASNVYNLSIKDTFQNVVALQTEIIACGQVTKDRIKKQNKLS